MAIQQRRGAKADFDATKMLPGELAVTTDGSRKVYVAFAPGDAKELASTEDVEETIQSGIEEIEQKKEETLAQFPNYEEKLAELEVYKANSIISTSSGTVFHETDCAAVPPTNIKLFGKGKQRQYEGNQLLPYPYAKTTVTKEGITFTDNGDGSVTICGTATNDVYFQFAHTIYDNAIDIEAGTYTTSCDGLVDGMVYITYLNNIKTYKEGTFTTEESEIVDMAIRVLGGATVNTTIYPMLNTGTTALPWEPYVGGEASPNMNYPQEVECLGESGSIKQSIYNKNLYCGRYYYLAYTNGIGILRNKDEVAFPYNPKVETDGVAKIVPCHAGKTYTMSVRGVNENCVYGITEYDSIESAFKSSNAIGYCVYGTSSYTKSYTAKQNGILLCGVAGKWTDGNTTIHVCTEDEEVQVEIGEVATEYEEPVDVQEFTSLTPNGLRGIPLGQTIPDAIKNSPIHMSGVYWDSVEGQYYIADTKNENGKDAQRVNTVDLSTLTWEKNEKWWQTTIDNLVYVSKNTELGLAMCTTYHIRACHGFSTASGSEFGVDTSNIKFARNESEETPVGELTYILAEPIVTESTDQYDVVMNYPNTTIVNDAGAYMEVTHVKDTQKHIEQNYVSKEAYSEHENRIAELEKAIVNS